jgi:septum formation protein
MSLILASSSPRRRELLTQLGVSFAIRTPQIQEIRHPGERAADYVRRLSLEKALAVAATLAGSQYVLAADTTVVLPDATRPTGERILEKPASAAEARDMLSRLRGRDHRVVTAFTLAATDGRRQPHTQAVQTIVRMRDYTDAEIAAYIATGDPFDKAGGYAIQHSGFAPVASITGSHSNVVGLPLEEVAAALMDWGLL